MLLLEPTAVLVRGAVREAAVLEAVALRSRGAVVMIVIASVRKTSSHVEVHFAS